jgi:hypothetical protein
MAVTKEEATAEAVNEPPEDLREAWRLIAANNPNETTVKALKLNKPKKAAKWQNAGHGSIQNERK